MLQRIIFLLFTIGGGILFYLSLSYTSPFTYDPLGPRPFPLIITGAIFLISALLATKQPAEINLSRTQLIKGLIAIVALVLTALLLNWLGFLITSFLLSIVFAKLFNATNLQALIAGLVISLVSYILFVVLLDVSLAPGLLEGII